MKWTCLETTLTVKSVFCLALIRVLCPCTIKSRPSLSRQAPLCRTRTMIRFQPRPAKTTPSSVAPTPWRSWVASRPTPLRCPSPRPSPWRTSHTSCRSDSAYGWRSQHHRTRATRASLRPAYLWDSRFERSLGKWTCLPILSWPCLIRSFLCDSLKCLKKQSKNAWNAHIFAFAQILEQM